jgi:small subunit ribosomal protein S17
MAFSKKHKAKKGHNDIGIDAKPPENRCNDAKCPWHGYLPLRGRQFVGKVVSARTPKTAIVQWDFVHFIPKYERYERRRSRITAYSPECIGAKEGDTVRIAECKMISKTKAFTVIEVMHPKM